MLPLVHRRRTVLALLEPREADERHRFYDERWDTWRWRLLFRLFFSRTAMGRLGRDPEFFRYVDTDVAGAILRRTRHALRELDPADNPYVQVATVMIKFGDTAYQLHADIGAARARMIGTSFLFMASAFR